MQTRIRLCHLIFLFLGALHMTFGHEGHEGEGLSEGDIVHHQCKLGHIHGVSMDTDEGKIIQFRKIPFGKPPTGSRRFLEPEPAGKWEGTLDALEYGPSCMQNLLSNDLPLIPDKELSEDCLHLNIFVPKIIDSDYKLPVMVWVHGGGFVAGQGSMIDASLLSLRQDVVVVTINYRLNIFGFFSTGSGTYPGNLGLLDQQLAFQWVKNNIESFRGDANSITIFGESAGSVSVSLHGLIPSNVDLFHRIIGESGSATSIDSNADAMVNISQKVAAILNCTGTESSKVMCLQSQNASDILNAYSKVPGNAMGPRVDGQLIRKHPKDLLRDAESPEVRFFQSLDVIFGLNSAETGLFYFNTLAYQQQLGFNASVGIPSSFICQIAAPMYTKLFFNDCKKIQENICQEFSPKVPGSSLSFQTQLAAMFYESYFAYEVQSLQAAHAKGNTQAKTYGYFFDVTPPWKWIKDRPLWLRGANHVDELPFVFGLESYYKPLSLIKDQENATSRRVMTYWANFARTGNPNSDSGDDWPVFDDTHKVLQIMETEDMSREIFPELMTFWNNQHNHGYCSMTTQPNVITKSTHVVESGTNKHPGNPTLLVILLISFCVLIANL